MGCLRIFAYVYIAVSLVEGLTQEQQEKVKVHFKDCIATTGANSESVQKSCNGQFADNSKVAEFVICFFKKVGFVNEGGELQENVVNAKISSDLSEEDVKVVVAKCNGQLEKDNNEKAYNIYKCYWNATPNHINLAS